MTSRLTRLTTTRGAGFPGDGNDPDAPAFGVQNLRYTYDPSGHITGIRDEAQQAVFFNNRRVEPSAEYTYDAAYRLIEAAGREQLGLAAGGAPASPAPWSPTDAPRMRLPHPGDGNAVGTLLASLSPQQDAGGRTHGA